MLRVLFITVAFSSSAQAADLTNEIQKCRLLHTEQSRLLCYDRIQVQTGTELQPVVAQPAIPPVVATPVVPAATVQATPAAMPATVVQPTPTAPTVAAAPTTVAAAPTVSNAQAPALFGRKISVDELGPEQVEMTISELTLDARSKYKLIMSNGQVWKQTEPVSIQLKAGDQCIISKGALGAFYLQKKGSAKRVRVKRVD